MQDSLCFAPVEDGLLDVGQYFGTRSLANQQRFRLNAKNNGHRDEQCTDQDRPDRIPQGVPSNHGEPDANEGKDQANQCRDVFEQYDGQFRSFRATHEGNPRGSAAKGVRLFHGGAQ
ncbi:unannotated protein [freshwater metagenome]|uniref:Unannotated protein n=1 Tax=freshwater metagenome TaxID=449393 RepID=A0A6J7FMT1_9ZZZZ